MNRILDEALGLFLTKGYEETTIQDIIDHLGGLSKGAIYHHFKSKEDILEAVCDQRLFSDEEARMVAVRDEKGLSGREKLVKMFRVSLDNPRQEDLMAAAPNIVRAPRMLAAQIKSQIEDVGPNYVLPVVREGLEDGSIQTDYPEEAVQALLLITNMWLNPLVYPASPESAVRKYDAAERMLKSLGIDLLEDAQIRERYLIYAVRAAERAR